jgi:hypothetical protein
MNYSYKSLYNQENNISIQGFTRNHPLYEQIPFAVLY